MKKNYSILPFFAFLPIIISLVINAFVYVGTRPFTNKLHHYDWSIPLDDRIPLVTAFMIPYLLAFATWIVGFIVITRENKEVCYSVMTGEQIAKLICALFFILLPTHIIRPEVTGNSFAELLTKCVYQMDEPNNLFPSIHCLESWIVFRGSMRCQKVGNKYRVFMFISAIIVFLSVLFTKQHVVVDIFGGIAAVEVGLFVAEKTKIYNVYYSLQNRVEDIKLFSCLFKQGLERENKHN